MIFPCESMRHFFGDLLNCFSAKVRKKKLWGSKQGSKSPKGVLCLSVQPSLRVPPRWFLAPEHSWTTLMPKTDQILISSGSAQGFVSKGISCSRRGNVTGGVKAPRKRLSLLFPPTDQAWTWTEERPMCCAHQSQRAPKDEAEVVGTGLAVNFAVASAHPPPCLQLLPELWQAAGAHGLPETPYWTSRYLASSTGACGCRHPWPNALPNMFSTFIVKTHFCP